MANLAALTPCQASTVAVVIRGKLSGNWSEELPWVMSAPCVIHMPTRCHSGPSCRCIHPSTVPSYVGKELKPACTTGSWIIFSGNLPFFSHLHKRTFLPLLPRFGGAGYLQTSKGMSCNMARRCPWKGDQRMKLCLLEGETQERKREN